MPWGRGPREDALLAFAHRAFALRRAHPVLRRRSFFDGGGAGRPRDVTWLRPDGAEMTPDDWMKPDARAVALFMDGESSDERDDRGRPVKGDSLLLCVNAADAIAVFVPPPLPAPARWRIELDTAAPAVIGAAAGPRLRLPAWSLLLLRMDRRA